MTKDPSRRGGILFGFSLTALLILCLIGAAGVYCLRELTVRSGPSSISIAVPAGRIDISRDKFDPSLTGIPIYPGAKPRTGQGGAVVEWNSNDGKDDKGFAVTEVITPDSFEKVVAYYRTRLPDWHVQYKDGAVEMEMDESGNKRIVGIHRKSDGTHIGVASVGEPASN